MPKFRHYFMDLVGRLINSRFSDAVSDAQSIYCLSPSLNSSRLIFRMQCDFVMSVARKTNATRPNNITRPKQGK